MAQIFFYFALLTTLCTVAFGASIPRNQEIVRTTTKDESVQLKSVDPVHLREGRQYFGGSGANANAQASANSGSFGINPYLGGPGFSGSNAQAFANAGSSNYGYGK